MRAGRLTEVIKVEKPVTTIDEFGASYTRWEPFIGKTKAQVTYTSGNRLNENNEIIFAYEVVFTEFITRQMNE